MRDYQLFKKDSVKRYMSVSDKQRHAIKHAVTILDALSVIGVGAAVSSVQRYLCRVTGLLCCSVVKVEHIPSC